MRTFDVLSNPHKGKHIHVTKYTTHTDGGTSGLAGVNIAIEHNVPNVRGKELQWVQTVSSNAGFSVTCKMMTRVDPFGDDPSIHKVELPAVPGTCKADDMLPFYWTKDDLANGFGPGLSDGPGAPTPAKGRTWTQFVTALTEVTGKHVHHLVAIAWGYDRMADGSVRVAVIRRASMDEMRTHGQALKKMYPSFRYT